MPFNDKEFALIGPGRVGLRLAEHLIKAGWRCTKIRGRRSFQEYNHDQLPAGTPWDTWDEPENWQTPSIVFVTVGDSFIKIVSEALARELPAKPPVIFHTSGLLTSESLRSCRTAGASVGSWHPLQSFNAQNKAEFAGIPCAIEGDAKAVKEGIRVADELGLAPWIINRDDKALYHAAAVVGANLSHILIRAACDLLGSFSNLPSEPGAMLAPLIRTSLENALKAEGLEDLTGPIARSDEVTIQSHLEVLPEELRHAYEALVTYVRKEQGK